jgi:hypothetical protein
MQKVSGGKNSEEEQCAARGMFIGFQAIEQKKINEGSRTTKIRDEQRRDFPIADDPIGQSNRERIERQKNHVVTLCLAQLCDGLGGKWMPVTHGNEAAYVQSHAR